MIEEKLKSYIENPTQNKTSDIYEHLNTLKDYGEKCSHITEMGVRWGASTIAFLSSKPKKMVSYDIISNQSIDEIIKEAKEEKLNFNFIKGDSLNIEIEPTEILFIDTLHTYNQLYNELVKHHSNVSKYIILHDTTSFGRVDENIYNHASDDVKNMSKTKVGVRTAMEDFLNEVGGWEIEKDFTNNNGLTILKKI